MSSQNIEEIAETPFFHKHPLRGRCDISCQTTDDNMCLLCGDAEFSVLEMHVLARLQTKRFYGPGRSAMQRARPTPVGVLSN
jgi:hypothetical protein